MNRAPNIVAYGAIVLVITGIIASFILSQTKPIQEPPAPAPAPAAGTGQAQTEPATSNPPLQPPFEKESQRAGMLSNDPAADEKRLNDEAQALAKQDIEALALLARDTSAPGDPRATAAELLARVHKPEAVPSLESLAMEPLPKGLEPRPLAFEQALRGRALEGLGQTPGSEADKALARLRGKIDDPFLRDRLERTAAARKGGVETPDKQDEKALRKLLDSP